MKQSSRILWTIFLGFLTGGAALAAPRMGEALGSSYLLTAKNLTGWHAGAYYRMHEFDARFKNRDREIELEKIMAFAGYDVLPWITAYGLIGQASPEVENDSGDNDSATEFGAGVLVNLLDHDILDNLSLETRIRIQGQIQFTLAQPEVEGEDFDYNELYGSLTLSVLNEMVGNKRYWPEAISLFAGPCFTRIDGDHFDQIPGEIGLIAGSDVLVSRRLALSGSYEFYEDGSHAITGTLSLRF